MNRLNKRGQLTIFVIVAVVVVAVVAILLLYNRTGQGNVPVNLKPVYDYYTQCIQKSTELGIKIAESQGGRIKVGDYTPGSDYAPFSNQLNFLGFPVPYWYYVAGNGIIKEQVPSKSEIESELADFIKEDLANCDFSLFYQQGYDINLKNNDIKVSIVDTSVGVDVLSDLSVARNNESAIQSEYKINLDSKFGKFYAKAVEIYNKESADAFLENYTIDTLRLNAPIDGVEIQCNAKVWKTQEVMQNLVGALENNIASLKFSGSYYTLKDKRAKYFVVDLATDENINVLYSKSWPTKINIYGDGVDNQLMIAQPVGNQEGLGIMGFCYVPYHYVYDVQFPVMFQIYDGNEMFQFPVAVVIDKNMPREARFSEGNDYLNDTEEDICQFKTQDVTLNTYDINLNKVDANLSYECFNQKCNLGETKKGVYSGKAPACVNGYIYANAEGYAEKKQLLSTNEESNADIVLDKTFDVNVIVEMAGSKVSDKTIVSFIRENGESVTAMIPDSKSVKLSEGKYEVRAYVYSNSSITIPASSKTQCTDVPESGLLGIFGSTKKQCFDVSLPEVKVDYALRGGGKSSDYFVGEQLTKGNAVVKVDSLPMPKTLEELQYNFEAFESQGAYVEFK